MRYGQVYVLTGATGLVKVGYSTNAKQRVQHLNYWCSEHAPLKLVHIQSFEIQTARAVEKITHRLLGNPEPLIHTNEGFKTDKNTAISKIDIALKLIKRYKRRTGRSTFKWTMPIRFSPNETEGH